MFGDALRRRPVNDNYNSLEDTTIYYGEGVPCDRRRSGMDAEGLGSRLVGIAGVGSLGRAGK